MLSWRVCRYFSVTSNLRAVEKSLLATLRKQTGYSFSNCKKALELNNNDLNKAQEWLNQQAQSMGWSKATKLEGRQTKQGLIGLLVNNNCATLVEVNCETDFVARNEHFKTMVETAANACIQFIHKQNVETELIHKVHLSNERLRNLQVADGKTLGDHLALMIGSLGENATLRRAICLQASKSINLFGYAHPAAPINDNNSVLFGKYGAIVALKSHSANDIIIGTNICQHIVGMNPKKIGVKDLDIPAANADDETCLIYQEYIQNPSLIIQDVLTENELEVVDFVRFECGEDINIMGTEIKIENLQTCQ